MKKLIAGLSTLLALLAAGCGGMSVPTFGLFGDKNLERSRVPPNSITYQCAAGKRFYLRYRDNGAAAWVILPEREFRLDKVAGEAGRYGNGRAVLVVGAEGATLSDGPAVSYADCKLPAAAAAGK